MFPLSSNQVNAKEVANGTGWSLDDSGVITITEDISDNTTYEWQTHASEIKEVVIVDGVTKVLSSAFYSNNGVNYSNLTKVTLSSSVEEVGLYAFADNPSLVDVNLNDELKLIGNLAFKGAGFTQITLPSNVELNSDAFQGCNVTSLTIPAGTIWGGGNA
ncbi:leucine-rich repeat domain-containing protein [Anaerofustis butyriciformans]|uniref:leucine-rich repeat domain-containing protein n=1 Tax=Anaerofustis butyriciformans TaxID=3108533 RepID=UPI003F8BDD6C